MKCMRNVKSMSFTEKPPELRFVFKDRAATSYVFTIFNEPIAQVRQRNPHLPADLSHQWTISEPIPF